MHSSFPLSYCNYIIGSFRRIEGLKLDYVISLLLPRSILNVDRNISLVIDKYLSGSGD